MQDYYKILGVTSNATAAEIKRAYRKKAKILHPDLNKSNDSLEFQLLVKAYEVLSDAHQKSMFDGEFEMRFRSEYSKKGLKSFNYRDWLAVRKDEESRCKLVFFDLMHNREDDAVELFKTMNSEIPSFSLSKWFTREDFMDYGFILAEELIFRKEFYDAILLLEQIIRMEFSFSYFKHFFPEVQALTKEVLKRQLEGTVSDELALDAWERALELGFPKKDESFFLVKMAETYERIGDSKTAYICLKEAVRLDPSVRIPLTLRRKFIDTVLWENVI